jgi:hypothetical protein
MITKIGFLKEGLYSLKDNKLLTKYYSISEVFQKSNIVKQQDSEVFYKERSKDSLDDGWYLNPKDLNTFLCSDNDEYVQSFIYGIKDFQVINLIPGCNFTYKDICFVWFFNDVYSGWIAKFDIFKVELIIIKDNNIDINIYHSGFNIDVKQIIPGFPFDYNGMRFLYQPMGFDNYWVYNSDILKVDIIFEGNELSSIWFKLKIKPEYFSIER